jgi:hypothetical protein
MPEEGLDLESTKTSAHYSPIQSQNIIEIFVENVTQVKTETF